MPADRWAAEFESKGVVVFPQRRSRLLIRLAVGLLLMGNSLWSIADHVRRHDMGGALGVLRLTALAAFVYIVGWSGWQLITRRPMVVVDTEGISSQSGRHRGLLPWSQIARIDEPSGIPGIRTVQVQPTDRWGSGLGVPQDNVLELAELAQWLRTLHRQHHTPSTDT
jgi:hypothetical protein